MTLKLEVGQVFHIWCRVCTPPKWKFYVLAQCDPRPRYFLINSNPAAFQRDSSDLMAHQVVLLASEHPFLKHDSVLDCSQLHGGLTASELEDAHQKDPRVLIGHIATTPRDTARDVVRTSIILTGREIEDILNQW